MAPAADDDPGQRRAHLTGEHAFRTRQRRRSLVQVHVVEDQRGRLSSQLKGAAGNPLAAEGGDPPAGGSRTGEGDLVHAGISDQQLGDLPIGRDHVQHTRRKADRLGDLRHHVRVSGSFRRALEHHRASRQERRGELVRDETDRGVPRDDRADHPDGLTHEEAELALRRLHPFLEGEGRRQAGVVVERSGNSGRTVPGDDVEGAGFARPDLPDVLGPVPQPGGDASQVLGPVDVGHRGPRPFVERPAGGRHGAVDVGGLRLGYPEVDLLRARVDHIDGGPRRRGDPIAMYEEAIGVSERNHGLICHSQLNTPLSMHPPPGGPCPNEISVATRIAGRSGHGFGGRWSR